MLSVNYVIIVDALETIGNVKRSDNVDSVDNANKVDSVKGVHSVHSANSVIDAAGRCSRWPCLHYGQ